MMTIMMMITMIIITKIITTNSNKDNDDNKDNDPIEGSHFLTCRSRIVVPVVPLKVILCRLQVLSTAAKALATIPSTGREAGSHGACS